MWEAKDCGRRAHRELGEPAGGLGDSLATTEADWTEDQARSANVHQIATRNQRIRGDEDGNALSDLTPLSATTSVNRAQAARQRGRVPALLRRTTRSTLAQHPIEAGTTSHAPEAGTYIPSNPNRARNEAGALALRPKSGSRGRHSAFVGRNDTSSNLNERRPWSSRAAVGVCWNRASPALPSAGRRTFVARPAAS
jgi:hypothetical protein